MGTKKISAFIEVTTLAADDVFHISTAIGNIDRKIKKSTIEQVINSLYYAPVSTVTPALEVVDHTTINSSSIEHRDGRGDTKGVGSNVVDLVSDSGDADITRIDVGRGRVYTGTGSHTYSIDPLVNFPSGAAIVIYNFGTGTVTVAADGSETLENFDGAGGTSTTSITLAIGGSCTIVKFSATEWFLTGVGIS